MLRNQILRESFFPYVKERIKDKEMYYVLYGGIPLVLEITAPDQKVDFLKNLSDDAKKEQEQRSLLLILTNK